MATQLRASVAVLLIIAVALPLLGCKAGPTTITGTVYVYGVPAPGARVTLTGDHGIDMEATADASGIYEFRDIPPGSYSLQLFHAFGAFNVGEAIPIKVRGGTRRVDLRE